jgi:hypothetical protein
VRWDLEEIRRGRQGARAGERSWRGPHRELTGVGEGGALWKKGILDLCGGRERREAGDGRRGVAGMQRKWGKMN